MPFLSEETLIGVAEVNSQEQRNEYFRKKSERRQEVCVCLCMYVCVSALPETYSRGCTVSYSCDGVVDLRTCVGAEKAVIIPHI